MTTIQNSDMIIEESLLWPPPTKPTTNVAFQCHLVKLLKSTDHLTSKKLSPYGVCIGISSDNDEKKSVLHFKYEETHMELVERSKVSKKQASKFKVVTSYDLCGGDVTEGNNIFLSINYLHYYV